MHLHRLKTLDELRQFVAGSEPVEYTPDSRDEAYRLIEDTLEKFGYLGLSKPDKGVVRAYLRKVCAYSDAQLTRLIRQYRETRRVRDRRGRPRNAFATRYTPADVHLLAETERLHEGRCGPAIRHVCQRLYEHGDARYARLANISASHIYNLRQHPHYRHGHRQFTQTRPVASPIAQRRRPEPQGRPGWLHIDTVHQGDLVQMQGKKPVKGAYYLNAVDTVTQWNAVVCVPAISVDFMRSALRQLLEDFPFWIENVHTDNGTEYINYAVRDLLEEAAIGFTKSRPRHSNDNGLAESKNAAIVRRQFGYAHIPAHCYPDLNAFTRGVLAEYVNFHRPCHFAEVQVDARGRKRYRYPQHQVRTPFEKLCSLPDAAACLRPERSLEELQKFARRMDDNEAARRLIQARDKLFEPIHSPSKAA